MTSCVSPPRTPAQDRIAEVCEILAAGLMRMHAPKSTRQFNREANFEVGFGSDQSGRVLQTRVGEGR